jgi:hypothetical protein
MRGLPNTKITLTIEREGIGQPLEISMRREVIHIRVVKQRMEPGNIGYVRLTEFTEQADAGLKQAIESLRKQAGGRLKALFSTSGTTPGACWIRPWPCPANLSVKARLSQLAGATLTTPHGLMSKGATSSVAFRWWC